MRIFLLILISILFTACDQQSRGFSLPPGDIERGRNTFVELGCPLCHRVVGDEQLGLKALDAPLQIDLGGRVTRIKTYGDLVTSVINPSHRISNQGPNTTDADGNSSMLVYNDTMTVTQLVDLVTFLQESYEIYIPQTQFPTYP
jgi:sulfur-oxidizing protein SoxX